MGLFGWILNNFYDYVMKGNGNGGLLALPKTILNFIISDAITTGVNSNNYPFGSLVMVFISANIIFVSIQSLKKCKNTSEENKNSKFRNSAMIQMLLGIIIISIAAIRMAIIPIVNTLTFNKIEIIAPDISDQEYKELKSQYFQIENQTDLREFNQRLETLEQLSK